MSVIDIRRTAIVAMFSDDVLMEQLVLKGGNALDLVHGLTGRGSLDIDFSIEGDFDNLADVEARCLRALRDRFDSVGLLVFDEKSVRKPSVPRTGQGGRWGGYRIEFKLLPKPRASAFAGTRRRALPRPWPCRGHVARSTNSCFIINASTAC